MSEIKLITLTEADLGRVRMLCGHSPGYKQGYEAKLEWMHARIQEGMHYTVLQVKGRTVGMIEYIPGEYAWRGVEAHGYLFIHCFWMVGQNRKHGYGRQLLQACLDEARGTRGVAVVVSKTHWLPTPKIFLSNGFEQADHASPSFDLLVNRLDPDAPLPRFRRNEQPVPPGLTLYTSNQCPYTQNVSGILMRTGEQLNIPVNIVHVDNHKAAQEAPCLYGTLGYFFNGELLTYRPSGTKKLMELIEPKLAGRSG